ncbi:MAG TPA: branched-chain amino acid transaminase [Dehalococcoidia bacterium]|jgi:branched-chain amino acid aminotransferase|nr:branched-chain amino acid transaminase [Dehalococcoidia bacterium]
MGQPWAFLSGKQIPLEDAKVGIMTHALHYGTAVFEGIRGNWNNDAEKMFIFRLREHYERLIRGCKILKIFPPKYSDSADNQETFSVDDYIEITISLLKKCGYHEDVYIRPLAFKSEELVANLKLHELSSNFSLIIIPFGDYIDNERAINCQTSSWRRPNDSMMPTGVKLSGLYTNSILAKTEAILGGYDEAILLNDGGTVSEGSGENLFMVSGEEIITPTETDNCLMGITRDSVIQLAKKELGIEVVKRKIIRSELYLADEIFLTGTAAHITSVGNIDNRAIGNGKKGKFTKELQRIYFDAVSGKKEDYLEWCTPLEI